MKTKIIKETITVFYKKSIFSKRYQRKILYEVNKIASNISKNKSVELILVEGSLARMELGKYDKERHGRLYSDIDILVVANKKIMLPLGFKEDYSLPKKIAEITKKVCYRYRSKKLLDGKFPVDIHVFNTKVHDRKLALKKGMNLDRSTKNKTILLYKRD